MKKVCFILFAVSFIFLISCGGGGSDSPTSVPVTSGFSKLPRTGQITSYAAMDDGVLQEGIVWPSPRFANKGNGTIADNLTGLVWLRDASCFGQRTWANALNDAKTLNNGECGLSDSSVEGQWRIPNRNELNSLINYGQVLTTEWLGTQGFTNMPTSYQNYWSSTTNANNTSTVWGVGLDYGQVSPYGKTENHYVLPVRNGGPGIIDLAKTGQTVSYSSADDGDLQKGIVWPSSRFTVGIGTEDECVTDKLTGLMWAKNANPIGQKTWQGALDYIATYPNNGGGMCGHTDWRLPNINELASLLNASMIDNSIWLNIQGFSDVKNDSHYWSSTTYAANTEAAMCVNIDSGILNLDGKTAPWGYVWPVRTAK